MRSPELYHDQAEGYQVIGRELGPMNVELSLEDVERLRNIGRQVMFSEASSKDIHEDTVQAVLLAPREVGGFTDDFVPHLYVAALDQYLEDEDSWKTRVRYHKYHGTSDSLDLIIEYSAEVQGDEVVAAKRALYRARNKERLLATGSGLELEKFERRTMTETSLLPSHIDRMEQRVNRLIKRAENTR